MAQVHRFGDKTAASLGTGQTVCMTSAEAIRFGNALVKVGQEIKKGVSFQDSKVGTMNFELRGDR